MPIFAPAQGGAGFGAGLGFGGHVHIPLSHLCNSPLQQGIPLAPGKTCCPTFAHFDEGLLAGGGGIQPLHVGL